MTRRAAAEPSPAELRERAIDEACAAFMASPAMVPLREWWEAESLFAVMPAGPVDPGRLAMTQGDRERLIYIRSRAGRYEARRRQEA